MALPNFIVIGAAKSGTTAMYWYLAEHPQVFMSPVKETNWFAYGVDDEGALAYGDPRIHRFPVKSAAAYEKLFAATGKARAVGEASPIYLECPQSAARIHTCMPDVRIICGLRNPVERAFSDYLMYLRDNGRPFIAERELRTDSAWAQPDSHWMRVGRYHAALARYYAAFPRENIHIFLFDDLRRDLPRVVRETYRFLGVDPAFLPDLATPYNPGGVPENMLLERVFRHTAIARVAIERWLPKSVFDRLRRLRAANLQKPPPLPEALRLELMEHFRDDIARTSALIGRDLGHWLVPATPSTDYGAILQA